MKKSLGCAGLAALALVALIVFMLCVAIVPPDRVGVRSNQLGSGVQKEDLIPGMWLVIPGVHKIDMLDPTLQELTFAEGNTETGGALALRTRDQYMTKIDVTIFYRIRPGQAWSVLLNMGPGYTFRERFVPRAREVIWSVMGKMRTEDFYNSELRTELAMETQKRLDETVKSMGLQVESLLIRRVEFDPKFEQRLIEKQLFDQRSLLAESKRLLENELKVTQEIRRETENMVLKITRETEQRIVTVEEEMKKEIEKIMADAQLTARQELSAAERYKREKIAAGGKLEAVARAKGQKAINEAYRQRGGNLILSRKMVENLSIGEVEINTNQTNPFDVKQFLDMVGAEEE